jgi:hypothetical protein
MAVAPGERSGRSRLAAFRRWRWEVSASGSSTGRSPRPRCDRIGTASVLHRYRTLITTGVWIDPLPELSPRIWPVLLVRWLRSSGGSQRHTTGDSVSFIRPAAAQAPSRS